MVDSGIISKIIELNLLAASPSKLAANLRYAGRTTINRLRAETTGEEATQEFCHRLNDLTGLSEKDLIAISRVINLAEELNEQMVLEFENLTDERKIEIVISFISDNYSEFSDSFRELKLNKWLLLKGHEKELFFFMLSMFMFSGQDKKFYDKKDDSIGKYDRFLSLLQNTLRIRFPKNTIGNALSENVLNTPMAKLAYLSLLTAIRLGGIIMKGYCSTYSEAAEHDLLISIAGLPSRTFWDEGEAKNELTFLKYIPVNDKGNGLYEYFTMNIKSGKAHNPAQLYFYSESDFGIYLKKENKLVFGNYEYRDGRLRLALHTDRGQRVNYSWKLLSTETSATVRKIDKLFTDSYLNNLRYESLGMELSCEVLIIDVILTKTKLVLATSDESKYFISRNAFPFLKDVTPDMMPIIYRDKDSKKIYVEWEELGCRVSLDNFIKK